MHGNETYMRIFKWLQTPKHCHDNLTFTEIIDTLKLK